MQVLKWLYPGMQVKRWLLLLLIAITFLSLSAAYFMVQLYREQPFPEIAGTLTLQFLPRPVRGLLFLTIGTLAAAVAFLKLNQSILSVVLPSGSGSIVDLVYQARNLRRGPKIVAIGGGTGLSNLLRGLKECSGNLTAIVTVADDGGSSGRLRRELGVLPPGDFRQCLVALSDVEPLMTRLFQYRFGEGTGLEGHSFGNLFIVAMTAITGNFERAIRESSRVLAVRGQILPSTLENLTLEAEFEDEKRVSGESAIPEARSSIRRVFLEPPQPPGYPEAVRAILEADIIVIGPGSLYTSLLPNLLVDDIGRALKATNALKVYVCNVATQRGETDDYTVQEHVEALVRHVGSPIVDYVLANDNLDVQMPPGSPSIPVRMNGVWPADLPIRVVLADVIDPSNPIRHDPKKLVQSILRLYYDRPSRERHSREKELEEAAGSL
ncbi:MAG: YvcK family protein [Chloroflexi bacterium]|nr:YvcK family protein [Chloroflexota bacterium]